jgi:hypothetical protein
VTRHPFGIAIPSRPGRNLLRYQSEQTSSPTRLKARAPVHVQHPA